jgi:hypothetical protein
MYIPFLADIKTWDASKHTEYTYRPVVLRSCSELCTYDFPGFSGLSLHDHNQGLDLDSRGYADESNIT